MLTILVAECSAATCTAYQGNCVDDVCVCNIGYFGSACEEDQLSCQRRHCSGHGKCLNVQPNQYKCLCNTDYYTPDCSLTGEQCRAQECSNKGSCTDQNVCQCDHNQDPAKKCSECLQSHLNIEEKCYHQSCVESNVICSNNGICNVDHCKCNNTKMGPQCQYNQQECDTNYCHSNGICQLAQELTVCKCQDGYSDATCSKCAEDYVLVGQKCIPQVCVDEGTICSDHGTCQTTAVKYCKCETGFYGQLCNLSLEQCNAQICSSNGVCEQKTQENQICKCNEGLIDDICTQCYGDFVISTTGCYPQSCVNDNKMCSDAGKCKNAKCECENEKYGDFCQYTKAECREQVCFNQGDCIFSESSKCTCDDLFLLPFCEKCQINYGIVDHKCVFSACINEEKECSGNGACLEQKCKCNANYFGEKCQYNAADCAEKQCNGHGTCDLNGCVCTTLWSGQYCDQCVGEMVQVVNDGCYSKNCVSENIICSDAGQCDTLSSACICNESVFGKYCQYTPEQCKKEMCSNHGKCVAEKGKQQCQCEVQYTGSDCGDCAQGLMAGYIKDERVCVDKHCVEASLAKVCTDAGVCKDSACVCNKGYVGLQCQYTESQCRKEKCNGKGNCVVKDNKLMCSCSGAILEQCCQLGSIGNKCLTSGGIASAVIAFLLIGAIIVALIFYWKYYQRVKMQRANNLNAKYYNCEKIKTCTGSENFFYL